MEPGGRRGARQGGEGRGRGQRGQREGGRASVRWADAASSPELPGYLDLPDHSAPFPCILETISRGCGCAHSQPDPDPALIAPAPAPTDELGRAIGFPAAIEERSQARLDWIIGSSQSIPPPLISLPCSPRFPVRALKATACIVVLLSARLARRESAGKKASRHASHV